MLNDKDYCDYDICLTLREIGCRIKTEWYFHQPSYERGSSCYLCFGIPRETSVLDEADYIPRLSLYEAQKWFREEKKIEVNATSDFISEHHWFWQIKSLINANNDVSYPYYRSYEEALLDGIKEAIMILEEESDDKQ